MDRNRRKNLKHQERKPKAAKAKSKILRDKPTSDSLDLQELNYNIDNLSNSTSAGDTDRSDIFNRYIYCSTIILNDKTYRGQ